MNGLLPDMLKFYSDRGRSEKSARYDGRPRMCQASRVFHQDSIRFVEGIWVGVCQDGETSRVFTCS